MNKVWVWVGFPMGIGVVMLLLVFMGSGDGGKSGIQYIDVMTMDGISSKVGVIDKKEGKGRPAKKGDMVLIFYTGKLKNGQEFDSNKNGKPMPVQVAGGRMIPGFDNGLIGMKVGGVRELIIPSELAYGPEGSPPVIPPNAELRFEIELLKMQP